MSIKQKPAVVLAVLAVNPIPWSLHSLTSYQLLASSTVRDRKEKSYSRSAYALFPAWEKQRISGPMRLGDKRINRFSKVRRGRLQLHAVDKPSGSCT